MTDMQPVHMLIEKGKYTTNERELEAAIGIVKLRHEPQDAANWYEKVKKSPFQVKVLREVFKITPFPSIGLRRDLSVLLAIPQRCIQIWFQNTRQAERKGKGSFRHKYASSPDSSEYSSDNISSKRLLGIIGSVRSSMPL